MEGKQVRRRRRDNAADAANMKLRTTTLSNGEGGSIAAKFQTALAEKQNKKESMDALEGAYKKLHEKRKMESEKMKNELMKMLDSDEDDSLEKRRAARNKAQQKQKQPGKLKGKWDNFAKDQEAAEQKKLDSERKRREKQDRDERRKAKRDLEEKGEDIKEHKMLATAGRATRKPNKIKTNFENLAQEQEEERLRKIAEARYNRVKAESQKMDAEKSVWESNIGVDEEQLSSTSRQTSKDSESQPKKLNLNFTEKEAQRQREAEAKIYEERMNRLKNENERMQSEYNQRLSSTASFDETEVGNKIINSERVANPGKITSVNFLKELSEIEKIEQDLAKISDEKHALERTIQHCDNELRSLTDVNPMDFPDEETYQLYMENIQDQLADVKHRRNQTQELLLQTSCTERQLMRALKEELERTGQKGTVKRTGDMDKNKTQFDILERERRQKEQDRLYQDKMAKLELERARMKNEQKLFEIEQRDKQREENLQNDLFKSFDAPSGKQPKKLDDKLVMFDAVNHQRQLESRQELNHNKMAQLQEEMAKFKQQQEEERRKERNEDSEDDDNQKGINYNVQPGRINTDFDKAQAEEFERQREDLQKEKMRLLEEEISFMKQARLGTEGYSSDGSIDVKSSCNIQPMRQDDILLRAPKKLAKKLFENTNLDKQRTAEQERIREERDAKLQQERQMFAMQKQHHPDADYEDEDDFPAPPPQSASKKKGKKMNSDNFLAKLQEEQRKKDEEALMEKKLERMNLEQNEMLLSEQKNQMEAEMYASDDDEVSYSDEDDLSDDERLDSQASGAPIFVQQLDPSMDVMEGHPVKFETQINMYPHGNVIWYYNRRPIRSSEDYQYLNQGNTYSLYMPETYIDDSGEYICKIENSKGVATTLCKLTIVEDPSLDY